MEDLDFTNQGRLGSMDETLGGQKRSEKFMEDNIAWASGARVAFVHNMETLFTYADCPNPDAQGTVVSVRTASGDCTSFNDKVFVLWDDGGFRPIFSKHLKSAFGKKVAGSFSRRIKTSMDLEGFLRVGSDLVHKATRDLWALRQDGDDFIIERLFQESGEPLKV